MPEFSAVFIIVERAPALIKPHRVGLLIARLMACETAPVLPVKQATFLMHLSIMCETGTVTLEVMYRQEQQLSHSSTYPVRWLFIDNGWFDDSMTPTASGVPSS